MSPERYPLLVDLNRRPVLVVGGGKVATRKVKRLLTTGAIVTVVSPDASEPIQQQAKAGAVEWLRRGAVPEDVVGAELVFLTSNNPDLNRTLAEVARAQGVWVNQADVEGGGDFQVPAEARCQDLRVFLSTGGKSPALARRLRRDMERHLEGGWGAMLSALEPLRAELKSGRLGPEARAEFWRLFPNEAAWGALAARGAEGVREEAERCVSLLSE